MTIVAERKIAVVLVRARNPLNIGAAARAMSNFGFHDLRVVNEYAVPFEDARSAVGAAPVLATAKSFASVPEAISDCSLVYGTTALGSRRLEHPVDLLREAANRVAAHAERIALLFGSEKTGLSNEELSHCHRLLTVPMHDGGVSMNLGQAVAVCLYELVREGEAPRALPEAPSLADAAEVQRFEDLFREVLTASGYERRFPGNMATNTLHRLVRRLALHAEDAPVWMGMLRHMQRKLQRSEEA